jgi:hypothetical protein
MRIYVYRPSLIEKGESVQGRSPASDNAGARAYIDKVMALTPPFSVLYEKDAANLLSQLKRQTAAASAGAVPGS